MYPDSSGSDSPSVGVVPQVVAVSLAPQVTVSGDVRSVEHGEVGDAFEALADGAYGSYGDAAVVEVIRPAAIVPERQAKEILFALSMRDAAAEGLWRAEPHRWQRYDRSWDHPDCPGGAHLLGTMQVIYGVPTRFDVTIFRVTLTAEGLGAGATVSELCDEALGFGGLSLATCPRASLAAPPKPFKLR